MFRHAQKWQTCKNTAMILNETIVLFTVAQMSHRLFRSIFFRQSMCFCQIVCRPNGARVNGSAQKKKTKKESAFGVSHLFRQ